MVLPMRFHRYRISTAPVHTTVVAALLCCELLGHSPPRLFHRSPPSATATVRDHHRAFIFI
ncbi:hypothetical protein HanXRQr2_Chr05g0204291 [Helianthus annuus]|uniref:Uncharacterized protein n=1 Tax=Helianthus annuus TaxID=4232 RepID=A0A9K3NLV5_HELAN|nr:hypothetical protein HanXRQr2_Chr05g0204291 [Helianthus annuus]KAJ0921890.1 hypothetical protein HanPSC8_Chr05g0197011 [Helianthus annuus]